MALSTTFVVTLLKSGLSRKVRPSLAPGIVNEQHASTTMITNSMGIMVLENLSMPDSTPLDTITCVSRRKTY